MLSRLVNSARGLAGVLSITASFHVSVLQVQDGSMQKNNVVAENDYLFKAPSSG